LLNQAAACNDSDACTQDICIVPQGAEFGACQVPHPRKAGWDEGECCNAANGDIDDPAASAGTCQNAACSIEPDRGIVAVTVLGDGDDCKGEGDENPCTFNDVCDGAGGGTANCSGTDVNGATIGCEDDEDCQAATGLTAPACISGLCNCTLVPDLTVDIEPSVSDDNCFDEGDKVTATVHVAPATAPVNGGQFLITYDTSCLSLNSASCLDPYSDTVYVAADSAAGTIFIVCGTGFGVADGPAGNVDMLELSFTKLGECNECDICFGSNNPQNTYLVDNTGQRIGVNPVCSKTIFDNDETVLTTPCGIEERGRHTDFCVFKENVDCKQPYATVTYPAPTASNDCGNPVTILCSGEHESGAIIGHSQAFNGGQFLPGFTNLCCEATPDSECGNSVEGCWTVEVNDEVSMDIEIGLSPTSQSKPGDGLTRCIKFTLYENSIQEPMRFEEEITFGGSFAFVGKSKGKIKIPSGNWDCISAWDQFHTLRSCYLFQDGDCVDGQLSADFTGDPLFGGNWLIGGNLDGWKKSVEGSNPSLFCIDVLDYGTFVSQWMVDYGTGDTSCDMGGPHADINGDGLVNMEDFAFIQMNFLTCAKVCCGVEGLPAGLQGLSEISVRELRERGLSELAVGDLNKDGLLNMDDMNLFMHGVRPSVKGIEGRKDEGTR
jgi:hypothetical protein